MKKRLFRNLLILGLLLVALTVAASAATFRGQFYGDALPQGKTPVTEIRMDATFYCGKCKSADTTITPTPTVTLTGIQYPTDSNYRSMTLTVDISEFTCMKCNRKIGPIQNLSVTCTTATQNGYFCHTGQRAEPLEASGTQTIDSDKITFAIKTTPNYTLTNCSTRPATCAQVGIRDNVNCKHCDGCGKYFDSNTDEEILANQVEIPMLKHDYNSETGKCNVCQAQAPAHLGDRFYATFDEALTAYNAGSGGTLTVYSLPENATIDLEKSGKLVINNGAAASKITMSDGLTVTIENAGTISSIEMDKPGTLTIDNSSTITSIKTPVKITGTGTRTINITNHSNSVIDKIEAPNTTITVQNDGEIGELMGYFPSRDDDTPRENMVKLERGSGIYKEILSVKPDPYNDGWMLATADFSKLLLSGDYFYFIVPENGKYWYNDMYRITYTNTLTDVYFTCYPFSSIEVTGKAGNSAPVKLTPDEKGRLTMTVDARQDVMLTGDVVLPAHGLNSKQNQLTYRWSSNAPGGSGSGNVFKFEDILYGEYDLTLTVTDNEYHHSKSVNIHIKAEKPEGETIKIFLREPKPSDGTAFTKTYDGTVDPPSRLEIEFYVKNNSGYERTIPVSSDCYEPTITYADPNCSDNNPITVTVALTETGAENYTLGTNNTATLTVPGKITQTDPYFTLTQTNSGGAHVGDSIFPCLEIKAIYSVSKDNGWINKPIFGPVTPGTDIEVDGESVSISLYRLHPDNKGDEWLGQIKDFVHDPAMNEELTASSTFTVAGKYYVYAVMESTRNFMRKISGCLVIDVQDTEASSKHHEDYDGSWDGTGTVPIAANQSKSIYLSGSRSTIYTELLLGLKKNLTLCLNGKTLSATNGLTSYNHIRVTDSAALTIDDCVGTGTVKGAAANGGWGGIAYVKNGTITIKHGKFTGGTASTGGGAIVVDKDGTLNLYSGEISGNTVTSGNGGAIYVKSGGVVNMYGGKIQNNHAYSGNGGAIYVEAGGTLNLHGGEITGNTASGLGGGIYVEAGGMVNVKGAPIVKDNTVNGKPSNLYICADSTSPLLTVSSELTDGAKLGVSTDASYPALLAGTQQDYSAYFTPDAPDTFVVFSGSALTLCTKPSATLEGSTLTVKTGGNYMDNTVLLFVAEYSADGRLLTAQSQAVKPETPDYTFKVSSSKIKCFLLNAQTYTPLMEAFVFN